MSEELSPLEELQAALFTFVDQEDEQVLILTSFDEEVPLVTRVLDTIDGESPGDIVFFHTAPVTGTVAYVDGIVAAVAVQLAEANEERQANGTPPLAAPPPECSDPGIDPSERLRRLIGHMRGWLPFDGDHRLVFALLPEHIVDREAHARIVGNLVGQRNQWPWLRNVRLVLRDDRRTPFVVVGLREGGVTGPAVYETHVTVGDIADATARDAANPKLPPARRMNALLQCAALDVALGRFDAAIEKYGLLYQYYDTHNVTELKAFVVQGLGDVMSRVDRLPAARGYYLQALDLASDAKSLTLIVQIASAIGEVDMRLGAYVEANTGFTLGAGAADKLGNFYARADLLDRAGEARWNAGDRQGAVESWTASASVARDGGYDDRLGKVLVRLRDLARHSGYSDLAAQYDTELRDLSGRRSAGVA